MVTNSAIHIFLNPALNAFHAFEKQHRKERQAKRRQEERRNQTGNAAGGSAVDDDSDCAQCSGNGDEIQYNSGYLHNLCSDPDDNSQQYEYRGKQDSKQYLHGRDLLCFFLISFYFFVATGSMMSNGYISGDKVYHSATHKAETPLLKLS